VTEVVAVDEVPAQPWRNGGGVTRALLTWPSAQAWGLRISVADVDRDGPFSTFPGVERWFAVLEGDGVALAFDDNGERIEVREGDAPVRFDGARALGCALIGGSTRDLNVMAALGRGRATCAPAGRGTRRDRRVDLRALFARDPLRLLQGGETLSLPAMTLAWTSDTGAAWEMPDDARAFWIEYRVTRR
jgi:environmental stress-induced protein Ves